MLAGSDQLRVGLNIKNTRATMDKIITVDPLSMRPLHCEMLFNGASLAVGTCFTYAKEDEIFLITNWHNVTGRNPITRAPLSAHGGVPDMLCVMFPGNTKLGIWEKMGIPLYSVDQRPRWYEHPEFGPRVDVVAVPIALPPEVTSFPINTYDFDDIPLCVGYDVFILGFPKGILGGPGMLPIWKRGSIATEPEWGVDELPKILIDTATREGMSGSPVVWHHTGGSGVSFLGIYSGRVAPLDQLESQLGIVWKATVIDDIISSKTLGNADA